MAPRLLDLFCGAGGAAMGYARAGFDVVGVDIVPQPHYPFEFWQSDAMTFPIKRAVLHNWADYGFDAVHASPPCQHYANVTRWRGDQADHSDLLEATVARLRASSVPWVVENVPGAPMVPDFVLCGSMFGLQVRRHRYFLTSWAGFDLVPGCQHWNLLPFMHKGERAYADAMGCGWMSSVEARQAIPPPYCEFIGAQLLASLERAA